MLPRHNDPIAAIATAPGRGAVGIVRVSGKGLASLVEGLCGRALRAREKAAFTLRLDAERHLRLRLASAVTNRSSQVILTELLDEYLASLPEIDAMASRLPAARPARRTQAS